jgi:hypothetical protein
MHNTYPCSVNTPIGTGRLQKCDRNMAEPFVIGPDPSLQ